MTRISTAELANRTREIVDQVRRGEWTIVESQEGGQVVLVDALDHRLFQALAAYAMGREGASLEEKALRDYLNEEISLGKVADLLQVNWFVLTDSFRRLGIPLHLGPASLEEAREEIAVMRELLGRPAPE